MICRTGKEIVVRQGAISKISEILYIQYLRIPMEMMIFYIPITFKYHIKACFSDKQYSVTIEFKHT